jgi:hypothetical protein
MTAPYVGGGLALVAGSLALQHFTEAGGAELPLFGHIAPWRAVFIVVGLPGLLLALLIWLGVREPARGGSGGRPDAPISLARTLRFVFQESAYLPLYFAAYVFILSIVFAILAWYPSLAIREGVGTPTSVGRPLGLIFLIFGCLGTLGSQLTVWRVTDDKVLARVMLVIAAFVAFQLPLVAALSTVFLPTTAFALYAAEMLCLSVLTALMPVALQVGVPGRMRGRVIGLFFLTANLLGSSGGPAAVGVLSDFLGQSTGALSTAMLVVLATASAIALCLILLARRRLGGAPAPVATLGELAQ